MGYTFLMLPYYLTAAGAFTLGFLAAAVLTSGRREQAGRDRAWLADEIAKFAAKCRSSASGENLLIAPDDLRALEEAAASAKSQAE